jgi:hypothetical protein
MGIARYIRKVSMHGRALLHLRQVETLLKRDLVHIDLKLLRARSSGAAITDDTAATWRDVLVVIAAPLTELSLEMARLEAAVKRRESELLAMKRVVIAVMTCTIILAYVAIARVYMSTPNTIIANVSAGTIMFVVMVLFTLLGTWSVSLDEDFRKTRAQTIHSQLHNVLKVYRVHLSDRFIVRIMSSIVTGGDPIKDVVDTRDDVRAVLDKDDSCDGDGKTNITCETGGFDACNPATRNLLTVAGIGELIQKYCVPLLQDMADKLIEIKEEGVDRFDQAELWRCVNTGVDEVKATVESRFDHGSVLRDFDESALGKIMRTDIADIFKLDAAIMNDAFMKNTPPNGKKWSQVTLGDDAANSMSRAECFAACREAASGTCTGAYFQGKTGQCFVTDRTSDTLMLTGYKGVGQGTDSLMLMRPAPNQPSVAVQAKSQGKVAETLTFDSVRKRDGSGVAALMRVNSDAIIDRIVDVVRKYRFQVDVLANRATVDLELQAFYGTALYDGDTAIAAEVTAILERLRLRLKKERLKPYDNRFVHPDTVVSNIRTLSERESGDRRTQLDALRKCVVQYIKLFPVFESQWYARISGVVIIFGNIALSIGFLVGISVVYAQAVLKNITVGGMVQRILLTLCIYVITIMVVETLLKKLVSKNEHNNNKVEHNAEALSSAVARLVSQYETLSDAVATDKEGIRTKYAAVTFLADAKLVINKYENCNAITHDNVSMPMPVSEVLVYTIVGFVFVSIALTVWGYVAPIDRVSDIKILRSLISRIKRGDPGAVIEASSIITCAAPNPKVWDLFNWFGILTFSTITIWFVFASQSAAQDYKASLARKSDCV